MTLDDAVVYALESSDPIETVRLLGERTEWHDSLFQAPPLSMRHKASLGFAYGPA